MTNVEWKMLDEFPDYEISEFGQIVRISSQTLLNPSKTQQGALKVNLRGDYGRVTKSVKTLVAQTFVDGETKTFDTPMLLDGDQENVSRYNIVWRPRWFAWKYTRQLHEEHPLSDRGPIFDVDTGKGYADVYTAAVFNGILFRDIWKSLRNYDKIDDRGTFPTWQRFVMDQTRKGGFNIEPSRLLKLESLSDDTYGV